MSAEQLLLTLVLIAIAATSLFFIIKQHRATIRERRKRARFAITVRTVDADERGIRWTHPNTTTQHTRVAIGVKNEADKEAGETLINVVVPKHLRRARWSGPNGEEVPDGDRTAETSELLPDANGDATVPSKYLSSTWPRIGLRPHYEKYVQFPVELPPGKSGLKQAAGGCPDRR